MLGEIATVAPESSMPHATSELTVTFRGLHRPGGPVLLANAWDAGSARVIERRGARAIATTSAALAWSHGHPGWGLASEPFPGGGRHRDQVRDDAPAIDQLYERERSVRV